MKTLCDIEVYTNYFLLGCKDYHSKVVSSIEVSEYLDERDKLWQWLNETKGFLITFNGINFDCVVLGYIKKDWDYLKHLDPENFCRQVKFISDKVIDGSDWETLKPYKYVFQKQWNDVDLFLYWSKGLRQSKKISLKGLGIQLGYPVVMELPYEPSSYLTEEQMQDIKVYNLKHDLGILELLTESKRDEIVLRQYIQSSYKIDCWSWDAPKIASEYLLDSYCKQTHKDKRDVRNSRYDKPHFRIGEHLPVFNFKTEFFQNLLKEIQDSYNTFSKEFVYTTGKDHNIKISIGVGGIHSVISNTIYLSNSKSVIYTSDIASLYPTNLINYRFIRPELEIVLDKYAVVKQDRLVAKKQGDKTKDVFLKLILNSTSGLLDSEYSWLYSPAQVNALRITGQLQLLRTLEELTLNDFQVLSMNTDGIECFVDADKTERYIEIMNSLEKEFNFAWEHDVYKKIYFRNINSYIAVTDSDKIKKKGEFVTNPELGNSVNFLVIPKCLELYFIKGIKPEEVLKDPIKYGLHIYDMCASFKVSRDYTVLWNGEKQQRLNRFFVKKNAPYLYKLKNSKDKPDNMLKGWGVQIYNNHSDDITFEEHQIDTRYYLAEINKIISEIEHHNQLQLF